MRFQSLIFLFLFASLLNCALIQNDIDALQAVYNSFTSSNLHWDFSTDLCMQTGISCSNSRIVDLYLSKAGIKGTLATQIGKLTGLKSLDAWDNEISGTLPTELGNLTKLTYLNLDDNQLSETIPPELGNCRKIDILSLDNNKLSGTIPSQLGSIPFLVLTLDNNTLSGTIPTELAGRRSHYLYLSYNKLTGTIPTEFSLIQFSLALDHNLLTGTIPTQIGKRSTRYLNDNQLTGTIPTQFGKSVLRELYLQNNHLSGPIPNRLSTRELESLSLSNNQLTGTISKGFKTKYAPFTELMFASNFLECPIPNYKNWLESEGQSDYDLASNQCKNSCPPNRCSNGKICSIAGNSYDSFSCTCRPGMTGSNCEISACDSFVCENGTTCYLDSLGNPKCKCLPGLTGVHCEKDLCSLSHCKHGGYGCSRNSFGYGCICPYPWGEAFCDQPNAFATTEKPLLAYYPFSARNKLIDETGNGYNLSTFNAESMNYPHLRNPYKYPYSDDPMNEALVLFGQDIISTASKTITFGNYFSFTVVFSISKFYLTTSLILFTPNDLSDLSSMSLNILPTGALEVSVKGVSIFSSPASTILLNTLTVVTFTKQESTLTIFKNEKQVASITSPVGITVTNNRMYLGYNFRGIFDKVAIYPTFLKDCPTLKCFSAARAPYKSIRPSPTACSGCLNGGICGKLETGKKCFCSQCWTGDNCEIRIQGCLRPCKNGGTYVDGVCLCAAGYFGSQCESIQTCPSIISAEGNFPQANAYEIVTGSCSSGNGKPKRQCLYDGTWQDIIHPCI